MKKISITFLILMLFSIYGVGQQLRTAFPSPQGKVFQKVGKTDVEISYYRPRVKGRQIFGASENHLLKYGDIWFAGANAASTLSITTDVTINEQIVPAGKYAIYTIPNADTWNIMLYSDLSLGGNIGLYDTNKEVIRFQAKPEKQKEVTESLTFTFDEVKDNTMQVTLRWEYISLSFQLDTDYQGMIIEEIDRVMQNPYGIAAQNFRQSATFYLNYGLDLRKALEWINESIKIAPSMFDYGIKADILIKLDDKEAALKAISEAHQAGQNASGRLKAIYESNFRKILDSKKELLN